MSFFKLRPANWRAFFFLFFFIALPLSYFIWTKQPKNLSELWSKIGIVGWKGFSTDSFADLSWQKENETWLFEVQPQNVVVRGSIRLNIEATKASELLQKRKNSLQLLYADARDPYFSTGQQSIACASSWNLKILENTDSRILFQAYATDRLTLRACDEKTAANTVEILYVYCAAAKTWVELEYFWPRKESQRFKASLRDFSCDPQD